MNLRIILSYSIYNIITRNLKFLSTVAYTEKREISPTIRYARQDQRKRVKDRGMLYLFIGLGRNDDLQDVMWAVIMDFCRSLS